MRKSTALFSSLAIATCLAVVGATRSEAGPASPAGGDVIGGPLFMREPVLLYDQTGSTLTGILNFSLIVYNDGLAKFSTETGIPGNQTVDSRSAFIGPAGALQLANELRAAGSWVLPDQGLVVSDVPLQTVTVMRGFTNQNAHSFSYYLPINQYATVGEVIGNFIGANFPSQ